jgi:hypothetical protein
MLKIPEPLLLRCIDEQPDGFVVRRRELVPADFIVRIPDLQDTPGLEGRQDIVPPAATVNAWFIAHCGGLRRGLGASSGRRRVAARSPLVVPLVADDEQGDQY